MRAVNLIPADVRGRGRNRGPSTGMQVPVYVLLGVLTAAVALVTVYVLTNNSIVTRTATLNSLKTQVSQEQAAVARLGEFTKFSQLAQTRIGTVRSILPADTSKTHASTTTTGNPTARPTTTNESVQSGSRSPCMIGSMTWSTANETIAYPTRARKTRLRFSSAISGTNIRPPFPRGGA